MALNKFSKPLSMFAFHNSRGLAPNVIQTLELFGNTEILQVEVFRRP